MQIKVLNAHSFLAVPALLVMVFLLSVVPVSGKSALGLPEFKTATILGNSVSKPLTVLRFLFFYRLVVLENSDCVFH